MWEIIDTWKRGGNYNQGKMIVLRSIKGRSSSTSLGLSLVERKGRNKNRPCARGEGKKKKPTMCKNKLYYPPPLGYLLALAPLCLWVLRGGRSGGDGLWGACRGWLLLLRLSLP